jgi:hypothetical protein
VALGSRFAHFSVVPILKPGWRTCPSTPFPSPLRSKINNRTSKLRGSRSAKMPYRRAGPARQGPEMRAPRKRGRFRGKTLQDQEPRTRILCRIGRRLPRPHRTRSSSWRTRLTDGCRCVFVCATFLCPPPRPFWSSAHPFLSHVLFVFLPRQKTEFDDELAFLVDKSSLTPQESEWLPYCA